MEEKSASDIEGEARAWAGENPLFREQLAQIQTDEDTLFNVFMDAVKQNEYLKVSYILNACFNSAESRANFGNRKDGEGNTAYHHAAQLGHDEIIIILNDKRKHNGKQAFFSFVEKNREGKTPLQLVCENPKVSTFQLIWQRAGKSNHNPCYAIGSAEQGGNPEIIEIIRRHPKFATTKKSKKSNSREGLKRFALMPAQKNDGGRKTKQLHVDDKEKRNVI